MEEINRVLEEIRVLIEKINPTNKEQNKINYLLAELYLKLLFMQSEKGG